MQEWHAREMRQRERMHNQTMQILLEQRQAMEKSKRKQDAIFEQSRAETREAIARLSLPLSLTSTRRSLDSSEGPSSKMPKM